MSSTLNAAPSSPPSAASTPSHNAAPIPEHGMSMSQSHRNLIIIIAVVVGSLVIATVLIVVIGCRKKSTRLRLLQRAVTPLSDAEFDLWRRPDRKTAFSSGGTTLYKSTGTRYDHDVKAPSPICQVVRVDSKTTIIPPRPHTPPHQTQHASPTVNSSPATSTRGLLRSVSTHTASHHKSSMSLQDRPPTPYSPSSPPSTWDTETLLSEGVPQSPRQKEHRVHVHYPSVSEASDFDFGFSYGPPDSPRRESGRRESWVHHSRQFSSLNQGHPSFQSLHLPDLDEFKRRDY